MLDLQQTYRNRLLTLNILKELIMIFQIAKKQILTSNHINSLTINLITLLTINSLISILKYNLSMLLILQKFKNHLNCLMDSLFNKAMLISKLLIMDGKLLNLLVAKQQ